MNRILSSTMVTKNLSLSIAEFRGVFRDSCGMIENDRFS